MNSGGDGVLGDANGARNFRTTHWSVVILAGTNGDGASSAALERLCTSYWHPLYGYARRRGYDPHEAQDLTQEFFAQLLQRRFLDSVDREKGKFRAFLLASMNNFLANQWDRSQRLKRGGGTTILSLDDDQAEERFRMEPVEGITPEKIFERRWAETVLEQVMEKVRSELEASGNGERFTLFKDFLVRDPGAASYSELAERLGMSVSATTSAIHRLRGRFRQLFREEIAQTVASPDEVDEEIRCLIAALRD
jgi:RNA polymerase sigma factor (sigma-70 family)